MVCTKEKPAQNVNIPDDNFGTLKQLLTTLSMYLYGGIYYFRLQNVEIVFSRMAFYTDHWIRNLNLDFRFFRETKIIWISIGTMNVYFSHIFLNILDRKPSDREK